MKRFSLLCAFSTLLLSSFAIAGVRAPGKYSGVVFFDRWGGCILFSGVYLMYISEDVKNNLRPYEGRAIEIDAQDVFQPINPGDGLIKRLVVLGSARPIETGYTVEGTTLEAQPIAGDPRYTTVALTITNDSDKSAKINSSQIGFALLSPKTISNSSFSPSDGPSTAVITRTNVLVPHVQDATNDYGYLIADEDRLPDFFTLAPHASRTTKIAFALPKGSYQFLAGYGGGVHEGYLVTSNAVSIDFLK